jgi:hypothetical protein
MSDYTDYSDDSFPDVDYDSDLDIYYGDGYDIEMVQKLNDSAVHSGAVKMYHRCAVMLFMIMVEVLPGEITEIIMSHACFVRPYEKIVDRKVMCRKMLVQFDANQEYVFHDPYRNNWSTIGKETFLDRNLCHYDYGNHVCKSHNILHVRLTTAHDMFTHISKYMIIASTMVFDRVSSIRKLYGVRDAYRKYLIIRTAMIRHAKWFDRGALETILKWCAHAVVPHVAGHTCNAWFRVGPNGMQAVEVVRFLEFIGYEFLEKVEKWFDDDIPKMAISCESFSK